MSRSLSLDEVVARLNCNLFGVCWSGKPRELPVVRDWRLVEVYIRGELVEEFYVLSVPDCRLLVVVSGDGHVVVSRVGLKQLVALAAGVDIKDVETRIVG